MSRAAFEHTDRAPQELMMLHLGAAAQTAGSTEALPKPVPSEVAQASCSLAACSPTIFCCMLEGTVS